jgi:hypothetical protein
VQPVRNVDVIANCNISLAQGYTARKDPSDLRDIEHLCTWAGNEIALQQYAAATAIMDLDQHQKAGILHDSLALDSH